VFLTRLGRTWRSSSGRSVARINADASASSKRLTPEARSVVHDVTPHSLAADPQLSVGFSSSANWAMNVHPGSFFAGSVSSVSIQGFVSGHTDTHSVDGLRTP
jgi:hypothetical protein